MPIYTYRCECGHVQDDFRTMASRDEPMPCECCGQPMERDTVPQSVSVQADWTDPIYSDAAGIAPEQVPEARARFKHHEYTDDGRMVFRSKKHRQKCLKDIGMVDRSGFD